jgi:Na+-transporting NADH:ubiquinone oxidoreductase subunit NqrB
MAVEAPTPALTAPARPRWLPRLEPKHLATLLITVIVVGAEWNYSAVGGFEKVALTLGTCVAAEAVLSLFLLGRWPGLQSAYVTGISLTILLRPSPGIVWPFVVGALLSIGSKYVLRYRNRHLWNPSNFGIACLLLLAPNKVAILSHEFGNDIGGVAVIWALGLLIASRAKILHVSATYAVAFTVLAALRGLVTGTRFLTEVAPLTGPMYQLMVFFMLTDPRTTVGTRRGRVITVACIALLEAGLRLANDYHLPGAAPFAPAPPILALAILGPIALALDLRRNGGPRPAPPNAGWQHTAAR